MNYASILGIIGAPDIKNYAGIIGKLYRSGGHAEHLLTKCTVASFPVTSFLCLQQESSLEDYIQLSVLLEYNMH